MFEEKIIKCEKCKKGKIEIRKIDKNGKFHLSCSQCNNGGVK